MISMLASLQDTISVFFEKLTQSLGFGGYLAIALAVEVLLVVIYGIKSAFSYEARFKRGMNKANEWLFKNKKITEQNLKAFTDILKKSPKRVTHFWQQYIMYREGGPSAYLSEENMIEKPLRTSSWANNVKNLGIATGIWAVVATLMGFASQANEVWNFANATLMLLFPMLVVLIGGIAGIIIKGFRVYNLDDLYESYHIFIRFLTNACDELPPYIELDLLYTKKELSKSSTQLKEFYEANARKAKLAFEEAKKKEERNLEYNFKEVGVDGALLLDRAMLESENYLNKKTKILSQIAQVEAQKDAMRRNFENIQMDLQRKIQASKENVQKLIEQQAATTSRIEVGLLRQQQDKEAKKLEELQRDYDKEETRFKGDRDEHEKEIARLSKIIGEGLQEAERGMTAEYQSFLEKIMKAANALAEKNVEKQFKELTKVNEKNERELISVQTQIKRLLDENITLRAKLEEYNPEFKKQENANGHYDANGNFVYSDGSYHDEKGLFHDVDGNVYNMNGEIVSKDYTEEEADQNEREALVNAQINQFGAYIPAEPAQETLQEEPATETAEQTEQQPAQGGWANPVVEDFKWEEEETPAETQSEPAVEQPVQEENTSRGGWANPIVEDFKWDEEEQTPAQEQPQQAEQQPAQEENVARGGWANPIVEDFNWDEDEPAVESTPSTEEKEEQTSAPVEDFDFEEESTPVEDFAVEEKPVEDFSEETPVSTEEIPAEEDLTEKPQGKKRGRPRKVALPVEVAPAKKRGRPRKTEETTVVEEPAKKRGRPKKTETPVEEKKTTTPRPKPRKRVVKEEAVKQEEPAKKRGRPKKVEEPVVEEPAKKRGRPRKTEETPAVEEPAKKRGRPKKEDNTDSFKKISDLINEEEEKLRKMKAELNSEIEHVITSDQKSVDSEKEKLLKEFEDLKAQAEKAKNSTGEDIVAINKRLEELIKEINAVNNKN